MEEVKCRYVIGGVNDILGLGMDGDCWVRRG